MFHQRGYLKETSIADGTVSITLTCNPLELSTAERELVYALVDRLVAFEKTHADRAPRMVGQRQSEIERGVGRT